MKCQVPKYQAIDGVPRCLGIEPDVLRENIKFKAGKGDVMQSTFPKSGTHWIQYVTQLILKKGHPIASHKEFTTNSCFLEYTKLNEFKSTLPMKTFLTHLPLSRDTMTAEAKYVYVARNPWDVCVSFFHMAASLSSYEFQDGTFEQFVHAFISGNFGYGDYFEHVASAYALKHDANVFFVTYEELKKDTRDIVLRLEYFLGDEYGRCLEDDDKFFAELLDRCSPAGMKSVMVVDLNETSDPVWKKFAPSVQPGTKLCREGYQNTYSVVRSGKVGNWKEYFTPELLRRMELRIQEAERSSSFVNLWPRMRLEAVQVLLNSR